MLQRIEVNGFRSLRGFRLDLRPGLNVLIGPNGAGKTNVVKFLELMSDFTRNYLPEAISRSGGAGVTFNRADLEKGAGVIWARVSGFYDSNSYMRAKKKKYGDYLVYQYEFKIELRDNSVLFSRQFLRCKFLSEKPKQPEDYSEWDIEVLWTSRSAGRQAEFELRTSEAAKDFEPEIASDRVQRLKSKLGESNELSAVPLFMITAFAFDFPFWGILRDLSSGRAYNINPSRVREPEDIAQSSGIDFEGGGLASTLFNLQHRPKNEIGMPPFWGRPSIEFREHAEALVQEYAQLVNQQIVRIDAKSDPLQNKIFVSVVEESGRKKSELPIAFLSDGTVKWIALVVAILSERPIFLVEEPENFLHPKLQQEIVRILRATCEADEKAETMSIMTTHSETLLNALYPSEVVVTAMSARRTVCRRPNNLDVLSDIINDTGFGLGHLYVNDTILAEDD